MVDFHKLLKNKNTNLDSEPENTPGENEFASNGSEENGETLLAFEDLPLDVQKAIQEKRKQKPMINLTARQVPQDSAQTPRGITFLKPMHATKEGVKATIYKVTTDKADNYGNPVVVYYTFGGQKYSKGYKFSSDNLAKHVEILGADETKWAKKSLTIFKVTDEELSERLAFGK